HRSASTSPPQPSCLAAAYAFYGCGGHRALRPFPTRRSSDLARDESVQRVVRPQRGDADRDRDRGVLAAAPRADRAADPLRLLPCALERRMRQHEQELLPAVAPQRIGAAQRGGQRGGDLPEHHVARLVAVAVVDLLEVVDIEHADREREPAAPAALQDRKSTRLNSSHVKISYAVFCLKKKKK